MFKKTKLCAAALALVSMPIVPAVTAASQTQTVHAAITPAQQNFMNSAKPHAIKMSDQYGLWTSIMMAQAIIESNWGTSKLGSAPNYNLFGIKAGTGWTGKTVTYPTQEWDKASNKYVTINAKFRVYNDYSDSFSDNAQKLRYGLTWDKNYYSGTWLENTTTYQDSAKWLQGRYATSPTYANTLINAIKTYSLDQYDPKVENLNVSGSVKYYPGYTIKVYDSFAGIRKETGERLGDGAPIVAKKKITLHDGTSFYNIGTNKWIPAQYAVLKDSVGEVAERGVVKVKYVPGYSIAVWNKPTAGRAFTGQKLRHGTSWKYSAKYYINGTTWYKVGTNQWIDGTYALPV